MHFFSNGVITKKIGSVRVFSAQLCNEAKVSWGRWFGTWLFVIYPGEEHKWCWGFLHAAAVHLIAVVPAKTIQECIPHNTGKSAWLCAGMLVLPEIRAKFMSTMTYMILNLRIKLQRNQIDLHARNWSHTSCRRFLKKLTTLSKCYHHYLVHICADQPSRAA